MGIRRKTRGSWRMVNETESLMSSLSLDPQGHVATRSCMSLGNLEVPHIEAAQDYFREPFGTYIEGQNEVRISLDPSLDIKMP